MSNLGIALLVAVVSLAGTILTGTMSWRADRRRRSGSIRSSTAEDLWDESSEFRQMLAKELDQCRKESADLRARVVVLETQGRKDRQRIAELERTKGT